MTTYYAFGETPDVLGETSNVSEADLDFYAQLVDEELQAAGIDNVSYYIGWDADKYSFLPSKQDWPALHAALDRAFERFINESPSRPESQA